MSTPIGERQQWQVADSAAAVYERALVPAIFAPWAPRVVDLAGPRAGERVLDVACGTGVVARLAAQRVGPTGTVVGLDLNPGMLAVAAAASSANGGAPTSAPIAWRQGSAIDMPLPDASFDVVYCQLGLQFFPDRLAALHDMRRVLVPGGRLGLMVWREIERSPGFQVLADALARHVSAAAASTMQAPFALADAGELRGLLAAAGLRDIAIRPATGTVRFPSVERFLQDQVAGSPLAGPLADTSEDARAALLADVAAALSPCLTSRELAFPIEAHLASATR
jgi:ubiquinone/menaquinone biosynthesis C-methylase UbiE